MFQAKLSFKFYIIAILLFAIVLFGWYGTYSIATSEVVIGMNSKTKSFLILLFCLIIGTWTLSLFTVIRQGIMGYAYYMDKNGIHSTATGIIVFSLIFVIPVGCIPYDAILEVIEQEKDLYIKIDKSKINVSPILKPFVRSEYHFFSAMTTVKLNETKAALKNFMKKYN